MALPPAKFWLPIAQGFVVGAAGLIPGASGGVLAVSMGIYRPIVNAVLSLFKDFKRNFLFLLPYGAGLVLGILLMARGLEWLLRSGYKAALMYALMGMVTGGIPGLIRDANAGAGFHKRYLAGTLLGLLLAVILAALNKTVAGGGVWPFTPLTMALAGAILAVGIVIPGVSTSFVLMYMGLYEPLLSALNRLDIPVLFFMGLGLGAAGLVLLLFVRRMFNRHQGYAYYCVLGFLLGTLFLIFPGLYPFPAQLWYILLFALGVSVTIPMDRLSKGK